MKEGPWLASRLAFWARESLAPRATAIPATAMAMAAGMAAGMAAVRVGSGTRAPVGCGAADKTSAWFSGAIAREATGSYRPRGELHGPVGGVAE
jgi:hypothetical protein